MNDPQVIYISFLEKEDELLSTIPQGLVYSNSIRAFPVGSLHVWSEWMGKYTNWINEHKLKAWDRSKKEDPIIFLEFSEKGKQILNIRNPVGLTIQSVWESIWDKLHCVIDGQILPRLGDTIDYLRKDYRTDLYVPLSAR